MANQEHLEILKQGVEAWNKWREENQEVKPDISGADLRNQNLKSANFSGVDIRGSNFNGAKLEKAVFINAKGGLRKRAVLCNSFFSMICGELSGLFTAFIGVWGFFFFGRIYDTIVDTYNNTYVTVTKIIFFLIMLIIIVFGIKRHKFYSTIFLFLFLLIVVVAAAVIAAFFPEATTLITKTKKIENVIVLIAVDLVLALIAVVSVAAAVAVVVVAVAVVVVATTTAATAAIVATGAASGAVLYVVASALVPGGILSEGAGAGVVISVLISYFIAWRTYKKEDEQFLFLRKIGLSLASFNGTSFKASNLQDADFTGAFLKNTRFDSKTIITNTFWKNIKKHELTIFTGTILEKKNVRELLVNLKTNNKNLKGIDLKGANIIGIDFTRTDLRYADLDNANFSESIITGAKLYGTSREDWNIENVKCDYIYFDKEGKERYPSDENFKPGQFEELYKTIPTFEYYFEHGFTPIDMIIMDKVVQAINEKHPEFSLDMVSFDKRGTPHATFTVLYKESTDEALRQITISYERMVKNLESERDRLWALNQHLLDNPHKIENYYNVEGDLIDADAGGDVCFSKDQARAINIKESQVGVIGDGAVVETG
ncbi:Pentapeptide repeat-containing protein [Desulfonema limicola]|uniref:Pentapeptide repeat-containing protein n=1 Tax=Desulfonema limicola TaxID=45656 RepID=A0A975B6Q3_9BACT|nr:pentapeptide repeat-containing protein [Desulfonema limicola]QTA79803.1 Pentapeptide repeat-containing protein [Desulfonema limicola]